MALASLAVLILTIPWYVVQIKRGKDETEKEANKFRAINEYLRRMLSSADPNRVGRDVKIVDILAGSAEDLEKSFSNQTEIRAALHQTIGQTYLGFGKAMHAVEHFEKGYEIRLQLHGEEDPDTLESMTDLASALSTRSSYSRAKPLFCKSLDIHRRVYRDQQRRTLTFLWHQGQTSSET